MVSWWVPCLAKSRKPDFTDGLECDSNNGFISAPQRLFEFDLNNGPLTRPFFILYQMELYLFRSTY